MRYNYLILLAIFIFGCMDSTCPCKDAGTKAAPDAVTDGAQGDVAGTEESMAPPTLHMNVPDDSIYFAVTNTASKAFDVEIRIKNSPKISALSFRVKYDPRVLQVKDIKANPIFGDSKKGIFMARDMKDGTISFGGAFYGLKSSKAFKDETIATVKFAVVKAGDTRLSFPGGYVLALGPGRHTVELGFLDSKLTFGHREQ